MRTRLASRLLLAAKQLLAADTLQHRQWDRFTEQQVRGMSLNDAIWWLEWNDPNGDYREHGDQAAQDWEEVNGPSGDMPAEPSDSMTREEATDLLWEQVLSSREGISEKQGTNGVPEEDEIPLKDRTAEAWWNWYHGSSSVNFGTSAAGKAQAEEECEAWIAGDPEAAGPSLVSVYHGGAADDFDDYVVAIQLAGGKVYKSWRGESFRRMDESKFHQYKISMAPSQEEAEARALKIFHQFRQMDEDRALRTRDRADQTGLTRSPRKTH